MLRLWRQRRERKRLAAELSQSLARIRRLSEAGALELNLCRAMLDIFDEQLDAAVAIGDEATAQELMKQMSPLLEAREKLIAREMDFNQKLLAIVTAIEETKNG
jgi:hypothetical protein